MFFSKVNNLSKSPCYNVHFTGNQYEVKTIALWYNIGYQIPQITFKAIFIFNHKKMKGTDFTTRLSIEASPQEVFKSINNVRGWWTDQLEGSSEKVDDEFTVHFDPHHVSTQKLIEAIPEKKVVWLVTDSALNFVEDKHEWTGTKIVFEISSKDNKTEINFTHIGLVPKLQCYHGCSKGWTHYIEGSLFKLLTEGKGMPGL